MLEIRNITLGQALDEAADRWRDEIGWVFEDKRVSFEEMRSSSDRVARAFLSAGVRPSDVVAVWLPNLFEFALCEFACARVGAVLAPINTRSKEFEVRHTLSHSRAVLLVMVSTFLKHDFKSTLQRVGVVPELDSGEMNSSVFHHLKRVISLDGETGQSWQRFVGSGESTPKAAVDQAQFERRPDDAAILQYTSGTTALPKGALCPHRYVLNSGWEIYARMGVQAGEAVLNTQPFYHMGGSCAALPVPLTLGCRMIIPEHYGAERVLQLIERERCVSRSGYGAMYIMEMNHPNFHQYDLSSLRSGWCVGTPALMDKVRTTMDIPGLVQIYGSTEVGCTAGDISEPWKLRSTTCGRPLTGMELAIFDARTGAKLPVGAEGEIAMRGWHQMIAYFDNPAATMEAIDEHGWVHTGDLGWVDEFGHLHFMGRLKDMLKVGGENVSADEVEAFLLTHPDIVQVAVIGVPDNRLQEVVMAIVEKRPGSSLSEIELIAWCKPHLANFRIPRYVDFVSEWPLTGSGKIQKNILRRRYHPDKETT